MKSTIINKISTLTLRSLLCMTSTASLLSASELRDDTSSNSKPLTPITRAMILHPDAVLAARHQEQKAQNRFVRDLAFRGGVTETEFETLVLPLLRQNRAQEHNTDNALLSLPPEILNPIARYLERADLDALRATSVAANHMAADPLLGPNQNRTIVIRNLEDLAAFGRMRQGSRINGPVSVRVDCRELRDADLQHLRNATTVNLTDCPLITDVGLQHLTNATTVNLSRCRQITDDGLAHLTTATTVNLSFCRQITDAGLQHLTTATTVDLSYCSQITDDGLQHLRKATTVNLYGCGQITDDGLQYLTTATTVILTDCGQITDDGLQYLTTATTVILYGCDQITDAGLASLTTATTVNLSRCRQITDAGLAHLTTATTVNLSDCRQITDAGLASLTNATTVNLSGCRQITDAAKAALRARGVNVMG